MSASAGVFVLSFSSLLLELALTRLFSAVLFYHFAFLAISTALLGLGAGGVLAHAAQKRLARLALERVGAAAGLAGAAATVAALWVVLHVPVSLQPTWSTLGKLSAIYLASAAPFFLTGLVLAVAFARAGQGVSKLYAADLAGGAAACLAVVPLLDALGAPNAVLLSAAGSALASFLWSGREAEKTRAAAALAALGIAMALNHAGGLFDVVYSKGRKLLPAEFARWNSLSRVEVFAFSGGARNAIIDGDAATAIMDADPRTYPGSELQRRMMRDVSSLPNVLRPKGEFAIIGPGGGAEVLRAVGAGSPSVDGIEINPLIATSIMRDRYAEHSRGLYLLPQVRIHVADGRSWLRASEKRFDVVQMTLVDTWAATSAGAFALSENNLYTVEAFREYLERLKPDGIVAVTRWEFREPREALRLTAVAMEALKSLGVNVPSSHLIAMSQGPLTDAGTPVALLAKRSPFTPEEVRAVLAHAAWTHGAITPLHLPGAGGEGPFGELIASGDPKAFSESYPFNVSPVTDDAPFFFFTMKLRHVFTRGFARAIDWKVNVGVAVLGMVLAVSLAAVAAFLVLPLALVKGAKLSAGLGYFIAIGLGYILVEIALVQRFVLFLGHPTYAVTVVIFLLLLASGAGSRLAGSRPPRLSLAGAVAGVLSIAALLPSILRAAGGQPMALKVAVSTLVLGPLGFVMGMPFPAGLRVFQGSREWAWSLNAAASVLGSVLAIVIAINCGLQAAMLCGAGAYAAAYFLSPTLSR
ncbi:MAG: hypothetical protein HY925_14840 [Elusimicrobia bacterium]|nr:hypothetical protein [Elusimicrobiota bacterium]